MCAPSWHRWPDGWSGYGAAISGVQPACVVVAALPSSAARAIAPPGRQKSQKYLSFQQFMDASAPLRFCIASRRAVSARSRPSRTASARATSFQLATGALCHQRAW